MEKNTFLKLLRASVGRFLERCEVQFVAILLLLFAVFNIATAPYSPDAWLDEVCYTDPGATLALEGHFTSTSWDALRSKPVWVGNVPIHELALSIWFRVFGFSPRVARGTGIVYFTVALSVLFAIVRSQKLLVTPLSRILLICVLMSATGLTAICRNGRYDALALLLLTLWIWVATWYPKKPAISLCLVVLITALMPASALYLGPILAVTCGIAFFVWKRRFFPILLASGLGGVLGIVSIQIAYRIAGVQHPFKAILASAGGTDLVGDFMLAVAGNPSYLAAILVGIIFCFLLRREIHKNPMLTVGAALFIAGFLMPLCLASVSKITIYYTWATTIPATVGAFIMMQQAIGVSHRIKLIGISVILLATVPGFPRRCVRIYGAWLQNRPELIASFVSRNRSSDDTVFVDGNALQVYYPLRLASNAVYWIQLPETQQQSQSVSLAFFSSSGEETRLDKLFGGNWRLVDQFNLGKEEAKLFHGDPICLFAYRRF